MTDETTEPTAPEGVVHSHAEPYSEETFAVARVTHPVTGEEHAFTYPADCTDVKIRYEFPDSTLGEFDNPNAVAPADPDTDDVIWDPESKHWVKRVVSGESGTGVSSEAAG